MDSYFYSFVTCIICFCVIIYVGKIKVQGKELLPHRETAQVLCTLIFAGPLFSVILFHVGFFHKIVYTLSPIQVEGIYLLAFLIVSTNIIYLLYQIRDKSLHVLARYIAVLLITMTFSYAYGHIILDCLRVGV